MALFLCLLQAPSHGKPTDRSNRASTKAIVDAYKKNIATIVNELRARGKIKTLRVFTQVIPGRSPYIYMRLYAANFEEVSAFILAYKPQTQDHRQGGVRYMIMKMTPDEFRLLIRRTYPLSLETTGLIVGGGYTVIIAPRGSAGCEAGKKGPLTDQIWSRLPNPSSSWQLDDYHCKNGHSYMNLEYKLGSPADIHPLITNLNKQFDPRVLHIYGIRASRQSKTTLLLSATNDPARRSGNPAHRSDFHSPVVHRALRALMRGGFTGRLSLNRRRKGPLQISFSTDNSKDKNKWISIRKFLAEIQCGARFGRVSGIDIRATSGQPDLQVSVHANEDRLLRRRQCREMLDILRWGFQPGRNFSGVRLEYRGFAHSDITSLVVRVRAPQARRKAILTGFKNNPLLKHFKRRMVYNYSQVFAMEARGSFAHEE